MSSEHQMQFEVTDTFGGEANYVGSSEKLSKSRLTLPTSKSFVV